MQTLWRGEMEVFTERILVLVLAAILPIQSAPLSFEENPQPLWGFIPGEQYGLNLTTDKYNYDVGENVTITIRNIGDRIMYWSGAPAFWTILDENWDWVRYGEVMLLTIVIELGPGTSRNETWDQKYIIRDEQGQIVSPTGNQVPPGLYHANTTLHCLDCEANMTYINGTVEFYIGGLSGPVADAGGPYTGYEGQPVAFDASSSTGESLEYRWDLDNDGSWDTSWSSSPFLNRTYGDDYHGLASVEVRTTDVKVDIDNWKPADFMGPFNIDISHAQSFKPSQDVLTAVDLDVGINWGKPNDLMYVSIRETRDGNNLTQASKHHSEVPRYYCPNDGVHFDLPDISLTPGQTYWIVVESPMTGDGNYQICGSNDDYPDGSYWIWESNRGWREVVEPNRDLRFRTYSAGSPGQPSASTDTAQVNISNLAPSLSVASIPPQYEGESIELEVTAVDPGSDDLVYSWWGQCNGWPATSLLFPNDPQMIPDPYPSPDVNPRSVTDAQSITCGDNGDFQWNVRVEDDDGGVTTMSGTMTFVNEPPEYVYTFCPQIVGCLPTRLEGESTGYWVILQEPGSDDVGLEWTWGDGSSNESVIHYNDGVGPDPPDSPDGTYPFDVDDTRNHSYGDDGKYAIFVLAEDDDGGSSAMSADVTILNVAPSLTVSPPEILSVDEGVEVVLQATATEPGSDDLTFTWTWDYGFTESRTSFNDGVGPDPPDSPLGNFPFSASDSSAHTYGDDCICTVSLTVEDDDGGSITYITSVQVINVPPSVEGEVKANAEGDLTLRVAGEKWHDVSLKLYDKGTEIASVTVLREPGNPDDQSVTIEDVSIDLLNNNLSAVVEYMPLDDPINGQINGASPVWLIFTPKSGGEESRLHHTFNVQHPDTWIWTVEDFNSLLVGVDISFEATATDVGSDDLTFEWKWGDGESTSTTYFNDGVGPDPYPSPDINPIEVTDNQKHAFLAWGTYTVELTVTDDDGGCVVQTIVLTL